MHLSFRRISAAGGVLLAAAVLQPAAAHQGEGHHYYNRDLGRHINFENKDVMAPWNDPVLKDDFMAPWNNSVDGKRETNRYLRDNNVKQGEYYWH